MILYEYANEEHLVHEFIKYTFNHKVDISEKKSAFLVWGYELWLPEGGKNGYSGSIDLIATDEHGNVWLLEAKQSANPELSPAIWDNQILNYRRGLALLPHKIISMRSRRFLMNAGGFTSVPMFINENCNSLFHAFVNWSQHLGKDMEYARNVYNSTIQHIQDQTVISTVLADVLRQDVWENRPKDCKSYGYIVTQGTGDQFSARGIIDIPGENRAVVSDHSSTVRDWAELSKEKEIVKPTPNSVELYLTNQVVPFYKQCLENLIQLGWSGSYHPNKKAFTVDMPTKYGPDIRIHLGWVDFDGNFSIKNRLPGELGLKFNIDFRHFKKSENKQDRETGYALAKRLAKEAHYNGRAAGLNIQFRDLTEQEKDSWDWEMYRRITRENRDYLGRPSESKDFEAAWQFLRDIIIKAR